MINENKKQTVALNRRSQINSPNVENKNNQLIDFFQNLGVIIKIQRLFRSSVKNKQQNRKSLDKKLNEKINLINKLNKNLKISNKNLKISNKNNSSVRQNQIKLQKKKQVNLRSSDNQKQYTLLIRAPENEPTKLEKQQQNQISFQNIQEFYYDFQAEQNNNNNSTKYKQMSVNKNLTVPTQMKMLNEVYQNLPQQNENENILSDDKITYSQHLILNLQKNIIPFSKQDSNDGQMDQVVTKLVTSIDVQQDKDRPHIQNDNCLQQQINQILQIEKEKFINQNSDQNYPIQKNFNSNIIILNNSEQRNNLHSIFQDQLLHDQFDPEKKSSSKRLQNETLQQNQITQKDLTLTAEYSNNSYYINQNLKQKLQFNFSQQKQSDQSQQSNSLAPLSPNFANKSSSDKIISSSQQKNMLSPRNEENVFKFLNDRIPPEQEQQLLLKDDKVQEQSIQRKDNSSNTVPPRSRENYLKLSNDRVPSIKELEIASSKDKKNQINQQNLSQLKGQSLSQNMNNEMIVQSLKPTNEQKQTKQEDQGQDSKLNKMQTVQNNQQATENKKESRSSANYKQEDKNNLKDHIAQNELKEQNESDIKQSRRSSKGVNQNVNSQNNQTSKNNNKIISQLELLQINQQSNDQK
ncbi:hypothetical protein ABPG72_022605 [Tetrahymena utriculariae]